jgi:hypothetical protein
MGQLHDRALTAGAEPAPMLLTGGESAYTPEDRLSDDETDGYDHSWKGGEAAEMPEVLDGQFTDPPARKEPRTEQAAPDGRLSDMKSTGEQAGRGEQAERGEQAGRGGQAGGTEPASNWTRRGSLLDRLEKETGNERAYLIKVLERFEREGEIIWRQPDNEIADLILGAPTDAELTGVAQPHLI